MRDAESLRVHGLTSIAPGRGRPQSGRSPRPASSEYGIVRIGRAGQSALIQKDEPAWSGRSSAGEPGASLIIEP